MSEWTPGPWKAEGDGCVRCEVAAGKGSYWQSIKLGSGWIEGAWCDDDADKETLANAHLIAAAPDLYEALEATLAVLDKHAEHSVWINAINALANARGEDQ